MTRDTEALAAEIAQERLVELDEDGFEIRQSPRAQVDYRVLTIAQATDFGNELELAFAMRRHIAKTIDDGVSPRDLAALTRRMQEIGRDIEAAEEAEIEDGGGVDDVDDEPLDPKSL